MSVQRFLKPLCLALLAGAAFGASSATAQDNGRTDDPTATGAQEQVIVIKPRYRSYRDGEGIGLPGKLSLSRDVSYSDLDLRTSAGARELRVRVDDMARDVCRELRDTYPLKEQPGATKCYEGAYKDAIVKADAAIRDARWDHYYRAGYRY
jgi:UrcA family protein